MAAAERSALVKVVLWMDRILVAMAVLVVGSVLIYGFGAGYFSNLGFGVPTPWNVVFTVLLAPALLLLVARILGFPRRRA